MPSSSFTLRIYESEFTEIKSLVLRYLDIETGGDLFGLWNRDGDPVVQLIIGPGKGCRRTSVSFHQDTGYLQCVGTYLNTSFMLCHLGSWHSHHQLNLTQPSAGDRSTVRNNFPPGLQRYIMIIANIRREHAWSDAKTVVLHPYLFSYEGQVCEEGSVRVIEKASPFRQLHIVLNEIRLGAEVDRDVLNLPANQRPSSSSLGNLVPRMCSYEQNNVRETNDVNQWYSSAAGQAKLKAMHQGILAIIFSGNQTPQKTNEQVDFARNSDSLDLEVSFFHHGHKWLIEFPSSFDKAPARIFWSSGDLVDYCGMDPILSCNVLEAIWNSCGCSSCSFAARHRENKLQGTGRDTFTDQSPGRRNSRRSPRENKPYRRTGKRSSPNLPEYRKQNKDPVKAARVELRALAENKKSAGAQSCSQDEMMNISYSESDEHSHAYSEREASGSRFRLEDGKKTGNYDDKVVKFLNYDRDEGKSFTSERNGPFGSFTASSSQERIVEKSEKTTLRSGESSRSPKDLTQSVTNERDTKTLEREVDQWYESEEDSGKLRIIHQTIHDVLKVSDTEFTRSEDYHDLMLTFVYHGSKWVVEFPRTFDEKDATITRVTAEPRDTAGDNSAFSKDIVKGVQQLCRCSACKCDTEHRGRMTLLETSLNKSRESLLHAVELQRELEQLTSDKQSSPVLPEDQFQPDEDSRPLQISSDLTSSCLGSSPVLESSSFTPDASRQSQQKPVKSISVAETITESALEQSAHNSPSQRPADSPKQKFHRCETSPPVHLTSDVSSRSTCPSPASTPFTLRSCRQGQQQPKRNLSAETNLPSEASEILEKVRSFVSQGTSLTLKDMEIYFSHGKKDWVIVFRKTSSQVTSKLFEREDQSRSFCTNVSSNDVVNKLRQNCRCKRCLKTNKRPSSIGKPPYSYTPRYTCVLP